LEVHLLSKKIRLFFWIFEFSVVTLTATAARSVEQSRLALTTDVTWASKYMISGYNVAGNHPVWQLAGKVDLYSTGLSFMYWTALQADRQNKQFDEQDLFLLYTRDFLNDQRYAINLHGFYDYWMFPNEQPMLDGFGDVVSSSKKQGNKFQLGISMPSLLPLAGSYLVPTYNLYYLHYWAQGREDQYQGGTQHELLLEYYRATKIWIPGATYQYAGVTASTNYHSGDFGVRSALSHSTAALVSGVYALKSIFILSLNQQWSYEATVNPSNEFWTTFSFVKKF
jgi:hypothetical protein